MSPARRFVRQSATRVGRASSTGIRGGPEKNGTFDSLKALRGTGSVPGFPESRQDAATQCPEAYDKGGPKADLSVREAMSRDRTEIEFAIEGLTQVVQGVRSA